MSAYSPSELRQIADWLRAAGLEMIEIAGPHGQVRLRVAPDGVTAPAVTAADAAPPPAPRVVRTQGFGELLWSHPLRPAAFVAVGDTVAAGQIVALLRTGEILAPVFASAGGVAARLLGEEGSVLGYGSPVLELTA